MCGQNRANNPALMLMTLPCKYLHMRMCKVWGKIGNWPPPYADDIYKKISACRHMCSSFCKSHVLIPAEGCDARAE